MDGADATECLQLERRHIGGHVVDSTAWPTPDEGALDAAARQHYLARKHAVTLYLEGASEATIRRLAGMGAKQAYRLIRERCLPPHPDGLPYGWRGLIPHQRIHPYTRRHKVVVDQYGHGAAGALQSLLDQHPDLRQKFDKRILSSATRGQLGERKRSCSAHWKWFLEELRGRGYEARAEWPFTTATRGYTAICRYIVRTLAAHPVAAARVIGGPELRRKLTTGDGVDRPVERLFQRVEMDAHKLDGRFCVMIPQVTGGYLPKIIHRVWVIVIIEVTSRAVIGYHMSTAREVAKEDVLRTIKKSLSPWRRRPVSFSDEAYAADAGLPAGRSEKYVGLCWDETSVDGALAQTCGHVREVLADVVGSTLLDPTVGFARRRSRDDRPFIEAFFRKLGAGGFQRMTNTTGSNPRDRQGRDPAEVAVASQFQLEYAQELLDVLIANYNATPHTSLGYRSPLAYLEFCLSRHDAKVRYANQDVVQLILSFRKKCVVKGGAAEGRRPYVNFEGARYSGEVLANRHELVGQEVWVVNHLEDDARVVQVSTLDGQVLGVLRAAPPWHRLPHSLQVRRAINSAARRRMLVIAESTDAVDAFIRFVEGQAGRKLPVHPAYLEIRRILADEADRSIGQSLLEAARARPEPVETALPQGDPLEGACLEQHEPQAEVRRPLPRMRMAASD